MSGMFTFDAANNLESNVSITIADGHSNGLTHQYSVFPGPADPAAAAHGVRLARTRLHRRDKQYWRSCLGGH